MLKKIYTSNAPAAIGPYSQAILFNELLFSSGPVSYTHLQMTEHMFANMVAGICQGCYNKER